MIQVQALCKSFGSVRAARGISFEARDGEITGIVGANGAGKSTTLRILCGLLRPDRGTVRVEGGLGALLDDAGLYGRLSVRENIEYFGRLHGMSASEAHARAQELISVVGLDGLADRRTAGFSKGERMKTALARALVHSPRNVVLDEPSNGLDVPAVRGLRALLGRFRDEGRCVVFSSHVLEEVRTLCDRVAVVAAGQVVAEGTPAGICRRARTESFEDAFIALAGEREGAVC